LDDDLEDDNDDEWDRIFDAWTDRWWLYSDAGKDLVVASFFLLGPIDDVRIYDVALSAEQIEALAR
jgi:hypothetical protein